MSKQLPPAAPHAAVLEAVRTADARSAVGWRLAVASVLALGVGWAVYVHFATAVLPFDDAYISFRYAENLALGRGLVYNEGERVFGSSTPLYVLWLIALKLLVPGELATAAVRANVIAFVVAALVAGRLVRQLTGRPLLGAVSALALLVNPGLLAVSIGGMESFWFLSLLLLAALVLAQDPRRPWRLGLLVGLAILTRPEGVLLAPVALAAWARSSRDLVRAAAGAALPLVLWTVFSTLYYGSPIPQSVLAKAAPIYLLPRGFALDQLIGSLDTWVSGVHFSALRGARRAAVAAVLTTAAGATLLLPSARRRGAWFPAAVFAGLVAIYGIANTLYFEWYWPPVNVTLLLALIVGWGAIVSAAQERLLDGGRTRCVRIVGGIGAALLAMWLAAISLAPLRYDGVTARTPMSFVEQSPPRRRVQAYLAVGHELTRVAAPGDSVASPEIGALGAAYHGRILDPCGLISPEAMPFLPIQRDLRARHGLGAITIGFVEATEPDWIVSLSTFMHPDFATSPWFHQNYRFERAMPLPLVVWESSELVIYRRREQPLDLR